jgi:hypothetical protein
MQILYFGRKDSSGVFQHRNRLQKQTIEIPLLKEQFNNDVGLIHASLIDLLENEYLDKEKDLLVAKILELIHTEEGLPPCSKYRCKRQREMLHENQDKKANV